MLVNFRVFGGVLLAVLMVVPTLGCSTKSKPGGSGKGPRESREHRAVVSMESMAIARRRPARPTPKNALPARDVEVTFVRGGFTLYGTLSLPKRVRGTKLPAYLFVAGSGPQSRRVRVGAVEVFTELAKALVAKGAVVLRYDKRTYTLRKAALAMKDPAKRKAYLVRFSNMMPDDFIADARAAFDLLRARPEVNLKDITVVGHSQGGSFGPDIVRNKAAAKLVLIAPGMQRFDTMLVDQLEHQLAIFRKVAGAESIVKKTQQLLRVTRDLVKKIRDPRVRPSARLMGASKRFFLRTIELTKDMQAKVKALRIPTLIIQGDKDLKCIPAVLLKMKPALESNPRVRVKMVNLMTHEMLIHRIGIFEQEVPKLIWAHRDFKQ